MTFAGYETAADLIRDYKSAESAAFPDNPQRKIPERVQAEFGRLNEIYILLQQVGHRAAFPAEYKQEVSA